MWARFELSRTWYNPQIGNAAAKSKLDRQRASLRLAVAAHLVLQANRYPEWLTIYLPRELAASDIRALPCSLT
jgi:hypothetical protein